MSRQFPQRLVHGDNPAQRHFETGHATPLARRMPCAGAAEIASGVRQPRRTAARAAL